MAKIDENSIAKLKALFQDNEKALGSNFSQLIDFFNDNKVTDNGDGTFSVGNIIINVNDIVQEPEVRSIILSQLKASPDFATTEDVKTAVSAATANLAEDSKVVHTKDMRKPASDVAGIEEVNTKQDKIGYTPADDSKVVHVNGTETVSGYKTFTSPITGSINSLNPIVISEVTDLNTLSSNDGLYFNGSPVAENVPSGENGTFFLLRVLGGNSHNGAQIYINTNTGASYFRGRSATTVFTNWIKIADDSKVAHLSGANNFDTVPTVNNNPLLLASSLPSDLARTGSDQEFTGKNTFDTAPIDKTTGNPYITKSDLPSDNNTVVKVITQAEYNKLTDKTGLYVIQG